LFSHCLSTRILFIHLRWILLFRLRVRSHRRFPTLRKTPSTLPLWSLRHSVVQNLPRSCSAGFGARHHRSTWTRKPTCIRYLLRWRIASCFIPRETSPTEALLSLWLNPVSAKEL